MAKLKKVLVIDDDDTSNFITGRLLEKLEVSEEYRILKNGREAAEYILERCTDKSNDKLCPELILLDNHMPVMDGKEFIESLILQDFRNWDAIKIVIISSSLRPIDKEEFERMGVKDYVEKPLTEEKIYNILNKHFPNKGLSGL